MTDAGTPDVPAPVEEARRWILEGLQPLAPLELPLTEAHGCVAAAEMVADEDVPVMSGAEVEGFAIRAADVHAAEPGAPAMLRLVGWSRAGQRPEATVGWGEAVRISTGAAMPAGADSVVPVGETTHELGRVLVRRPVTVGVNVQRAGQDARSGDVLVPAGRRLAGPELGLLAAAGRPAALAYPRVRVAVLGAGDLAEPGQAAAPGQGRQAVSYALYGAVRETGAEPHRIALTPGAKEEARDALMWNLSRADAVVAAGAAAADTTREDLTEGVGRIRPLHVAMHPGGSLDVGTLEQTPYFGLPSSSPAALVMFEVLVRPALLRLMGRPEVARPVVTATLEEKVEGSPGVTLYAPVAVRRDGGSWAARPTALSGPISLAAVVRANGLAVIGPDAPSAPAGTHVQVQVLRPA